ncbi:MAG: glutaredoxin family protein [Candidatus Paceibacterota bacterium]
MSNVTIYSTNACVHCNHAKAFFEENDIEYTNKNVQEDPQARQEMVKKSGQMGVPVIMIDDEIIVGFNESKLREALNI